MHDLDRTLQEFEAGFDAMETDGYELQDEGDWAGEYEGDYEFEGGEEYEGDYEY